MTLDLALELTNDIQAAYLQADPTERRLLNQAFFERLEIDSEEIVGDTLAEPFAQITALAPPSQARPDVPEPATVAPHKPPRRHAAGPGRARTRAPISKAAGSHVNVMVEPGGFEPPTSALPARRSPS